MKAYWQSIQAWFEQYPEFNAQAGVVLLLLLAWIGNWIVKRILVRAVFRALRASPLGRYQEVRDNKIINHLSHIVPALMISTGIGMVPDLPEELVTVVQNVANAFIVLTIALAIANLLTVLNQIYERSPEAKMRPIKGYIQVAKIVIYMIAVILMVAALIDRSPLILLSGLGAMAAVLMLVFQDTLLSLVASVQIASNDIIRVGDWVEMPQLNADGDVIDIALYTVKVQNWDRTITSIPTRRFMTDPFKNWRGMQESGGRRIKRSLLIDQQSIGFLNEEERKRLYRFRLLQAYLTNKQKDIDEWNAKLAEQGKEPVNTRRITNIGTFRAYVREYLLSHPGIHQEMIQMVRQMPPSSEGLPLEIYCFTNTIAWVEYEGIQSDIFDHLLAILPEFGLRVYQQPSGRDLRDLMLARQGRPER